jgi:hypothetical protein
MNSNNDDEEQKRKRDRINIPKKKVNSTALGMAIIDVYKGTMLNGHDELTQLLAFFDGVVRSIVPPPITSLSS